MRMVLSGLVVVAALGVAGLASARSAAATSPDVVAAQTVSAINGARDARGLVALRPAAARVAAAAVYWSGAQATAGELSHRSRSALVADLVEGSWDVVGENVARTCVCGDPAGVGARVLDAFIDSPGHRANVLGDYDRVAVGARTVGDDVWITVSFVG